MSGYAFPEEYQAQKTAMGTTDQRPDGTGSVMLGMIGSVGRRNSLWRTIQRRSYTSQK